MISVEDTHAFTSMSSDLLNHHGLNTDRGGFIEHYITYEDMEDKTVVGEFKFGIKGRWVEHKHFTYHTESKMFEFIS